MTTTPHTSRRPKPATSLAGAMPDASVAGTLSMDEIEGVLDALCVILECTRSELIVKLRGAGRGSVPVTSQTAAADPQPREEG